MFAMGAFLVHVKPLSILFRAKFRDQLKKTDLFQLVGQPTWNKDWVVHCQPVGAGEAAFKYLAPYIFRVTISNGRILKAERLARN
jgi:Putative transposase